MPRKTTHSKVAEHIRARIRSGALKRGDRLPSFEQLHRQLGAARATVSKALAVLAVDGLVERRTGSGTYVAHTAPLKRRTRIAIVAPPPEKFECDYWTRLHMGIQSAAHSLGVEIAYLPGIDGIEWSDYSAVLAYDANELVCPEELPVLAIGAVAFHMPSVGVNEFDSGFLATKHLIDLGHRLIGFLGQLNVTATCLRLAGYHSAQREIWGEIVDLLTPYHEVCAIAGRIVPSGDDRLIRDIGYSMTSEPGLKGMGYGNMEQWLKDGFSQLGCTAIIVQNDFAAEGVMDCLRDHGYRVPSDVSVIAFDNERCCAEMTPPLTSVGGDMREVGSRAVKTLVELVQGLPVNATLVEPRLYVRQSTGPPPKAKRRDSRDSLSLDVPALTSENRTTLSCIGTLSSSPKTKAE